MSEKLNQLRTIPSPEILSALESISNPIFRPTLDNEFLSKSLMISLYSGTLATRFRQRNMKLLIGEVEHEELVYALEAPKSPLFLIPALEKYYRTNTVKTLIQHYEEMKKPLSELYTAVVTDLQVRASTRTLVYCLVSGGVPMKDILRYRISLPIKEVQLFNGKVPHSFDFMHWWYLHSLMRLKVGIPNGLDIQR
jgi:carboxylesterase type B